MNKEHTGIVANLSFLAVTANLVDAVLYTPLEDGNFLVSVVCGGGTVATPNGGLQGRPSLQWTTDSGHGFTDSDFFFFTSQYPSTGGSLLIRAKASTNITISTQQINSAIPTDIYVTVERLQ